LGFLLIVESVGCPLPLFFQRRASYIWFMFDDLYNGEPPTGRFSKLSLLSGVSKYPARHTSTSLAFVAAVAAFEAAKAAA